MNEQILTWVMVFVGLVGFHYAGKKKWWAWYINIACQVLWITYALVSNQPAFLVSAGVYTYQFTKNAIAWTKEHQKEKFFDSFDPEHNKVAIPSKTDRCQACGHAQMVHLTYCWGRDGDGFCNCPGYEEEN